MYAVEFNAIAQNHLLTLPSHIPDGVAMRVLLLLEEKIEGAEELIKRRPHPLLQGSVIKADGLMESVNVIEPPHTMTAMTNHREYFQQLRQQPSVVISPEVDIDALMQEMNDGLC